MNMNANLTVMIQKMVQFSREYTYDSIDRVYVYILDTQAPPQNSYAGSCDFNCFFRSKGRICRLKEEDIKYMNEQIDPSMDASMDFLSQLYEYFNEWQTAYKEEGILLPSEMKIIYDIPTEKMTMECRKKDEIRFTDSFLTDFNDHLFAWIDALRLEEEDIPIPDRTRIPLDIKENYAEKPDHRGWDAIVKAMECVYPNQKNPKHFAPLLSAEFSGRDEPLEGISVYETVDYYHFVSFGMSEVFEKISDNPDISGFGIEFTLKLKKSSIDPAKEDIELRTICDILQKLGAISHNDGEFFHANEYIYTGQTTGFDAEKKSALTGFITISDSSLTPIDTPNGSVEFVELIGCTDAELRCLLDKSLTVAELYAKLGSDLTDYYRKSVV